MLAGKGHQRLGRLQRIGEYDSPRPGLVIQQIGFAEQQHIRHLDLSPEGFVRGDTVIRKLTGIHETECGRDPEMRLPVRLAQGLENLCRMPQSGRLNQQTMRTGTCRDLPQRNLQRQILGTTDTPARDFLDDDIIPCPGHLIDTNLAELVDQDGPALIRRFACQQSLDERGLASAQKSGDNMGQQRHVASWPGFTSDKCFNLKRTLSIRKAGWLDCLPD